MKSDQTIHLQVACLNIRHKMMYLDVRQSALGMVDDSSNTRIFHCVKTQEVLGPDGGHVSPTDCTPDRPCYCRGQP